MSLLSINRQSRWEYRISNQFLSAGCGYAGFCFPKELTALIHTVDSVGFEPFHLVTNSKNISYLQSLRNIIVNNLRGKVIVI